MSMFTEGGVSRLLSRIGRMVPTWLPRGTGIGNRLLKPIYKAVVGCQWARAEIWPGITMRVNPCECVGGNLFFSPQLYDRDERRWMDELLHSDHVFLDVGANLGAYSLWATRKLSSAGTILAIEADPDTFGVLRENLAANAGVTCKVLLENTGVSDQAETLAFFRNASGNTGGNTFWDGTGEKASLTLRVEPLYAVIQRNALQRIDFMKIDIEGYELKVLTRFFADCPTALMPRHILIEIDEGPQGNDPAYRGQLLALFSEHGYRQARAGKNALFDLVPPVTT